AERRHPDPVAEDRPAVEAAGGVYGQDSHGLAPCPQGGGQSSDESAFAAPGGSGDTHDTHPSTAAVELSELFVDAGCPPFHPGYHPGDGGQFALLDALEQGHTLSTSLKRSRLSMTRRALNSVLSSVVGGSGWTLAVTPSVRISPFW